MNDEGTAVLTGLVREFIKGGICWQTEPSRMIYICLVQGGPHPKRSDIHYDPTMIRRQEGRQLALVAPSQCLFLSISPHPMHAFINWGPRPILSPRPSYRFISVLSLHLSIPDEVCSWVFITQLSGNVSFL